MGSTNPAFLSGTAPPLSVQRARPKKPPRKPQSEFNQHVDLINGLSELLVAAATKGWRGLYAPKLAADMTVEHRALLERVRRVLIKTQANKASRLEAVAEWPRLVRKLQVSIDRAKKLGLPERNLGKIAVQIEVITETYVKTGGNKAAGELKLNSYAAFGEGVRTLVDVVNNSSQSYDRTHGVIPTNLEQVNTQQRAALQAVKFSDSLDEAHRALLEKLRTTLILARTTGSAKRAVAEWKKIGTEVFETFEKAGNYTGVDFGKTRSTLVDIGQKLIYGGAYSEAHNAALDKVDLKSPTLAFDIEKAKVAAKDLIVAKEVADKAFGITTSAAIDAAFTEAKVAVIDLDSPPMRKALKSANVKAELGAAIWDIAKNPGEIKAKVAEYNKRGVGGKLVTIADIGDKMLAIRNALYKVSLTAVHEFAASQVKVALARGAKEAVDRWTKVGSWATGKLQVLAQVGKVAGIISIGVSVIKMFDAIAKGDWGAALQEAGTTLLGLAAGAAGGVAGAATFGGIGILIAAQIEGIAGAAAMIRYCKQANVREAALDFIHVCEHAASLEAKSLIADAKLLDDPDLADQREFIHQRLQSHLNLWVRHVGEMKELVFKDRANAIGGQPALKSALGWRTMTALVSPTPSTWDGLGKQIATVFTGANSMAEYVVKTYPRTRAAA